MPTTDIEAVLGAVPELEDGIRFPALDPARAPALFDQLLAGESEAVASLVDRIEEVDDGRDWKARFLLHALVTYVSATGLEERRNTLRSDYATLATSGRAAPVRTFVLQQLQLMADASVLERVAPALLDVDPQVCDAAAAVMVAAGPPSYTLLENALASDPGEHQRAAIQNALAQVGAS